MIKLFESTVSSVSDIATNGVGILSDAISCVITEELNGEFELEMEYPITGIHYSELIMRRLICAKPNPTDNPQLFRIYDISKPINGVVTINAHHISYDMTGYAVSPFAHSVTTLPVALSTLMTNCIVNPNPFTLTYDGDSFTSAEFNVSLPSSLRACLGGTEGSILDLFSGGGHGHWKFDNFTATFMYTRGEERGFVIRYGKNLTDLKQEENNNKVCTAIYPYWYSNATEGETYVELAGKTVNVGSETHNYVKILPVDFSSDFEEPPTQAQLRSKAQSYISSNEINKPDISLEISFVKLSESEEYADIAMLEHVELGDSVKVIFEELGVDSYAKCVKTVYDAITDKFVSIEIGDPSSHFVDSVYDQTRIIEGTIANTTRNFLSLLEVNKTSITAMVAEYGSSMWQIPDTLTITHYGYGEPTETEGYSSGDVYLDNSSGYYYTFNGITWVKSSSALEPNYYKKYSSVEITSDGINIVTSQGNNAITMNSSGMALRSGASITATGANITIDPNGRMVLGGDLYVNGTISTPDGAVRIGSDGIYMGGTGGGGGGWNNNWNDVASPVAVFG